MKSLLNAIAAKTPRFFAKMAAFSVLLGVLSAAMLNAPYDVKELFSEELLQAAKYFSVMSWLLNIICISQREYQKADSSHLETETTDEP